MSNMFDQNKEVIQSEERAKVVTEVDKTIESYQIDRHVAELINTEMNPFVEQARQWEKKIDLINVTNSLQVNEMKLAREARLAIRKVRLDAEKVKDRLKEDSNRYNKAVQAVYNRILSIITPLEEKAEKQEKFAEIEAAENRKKIETMRMTLLQPYYGHVDLDGIDIATVSEERFLDLLDQAMDNKYKAEAEERRLEEEEKKKAKEDAEEKERLKKENEELKTKNQQAATQIEALKTVSGYSTFMRTTGVVTSGGTAPDKKLIDERPEVAELVDMEFIVSRLDTIKPMVTNGSNANVTKVMESITKLSDNIRKRIMQLREITKS